MARQLTAEEMARAAERKARFRALWKQVANMPELERVQLSNKLGIATCDGHILSVKNQCLVALQLPAASVVGGFRQWQKHGRQVARGQHGAMIWIKTGIRDGEAAETDGEPAEAYEGPAFITGTVFDIAQTEERQP